MILINNKQEIVCCELILNRYCCTKLVQNKQDFPLSKLILRHLEFISSSYIICLRLTLVSEKNEAENLFLDENKWAYHRVRSIGTEGTCPMQSFKELIGICIASYKINGTNNNLSKKQHFCLFHNHLMFNEILGEGIFLTWCLCKRSFYLTLHQEKNLDFDHSQEINLLLMQGKL